MFDPFATSSTEGSAGGTISWSPTAPGTAPVLTSANVASFDDNTSSSSSKKLVNCVGNPEVTPEIPTPKTPAAVTTVDVGLPTPKSEQEQILRLQIQEKLQLTIDTTLTKAAKKARKKAAKKASKKALKKEAKKARKAAKGTKKKKKDKKQQKKIEEEDDDADAWPGSDEEDDEEEDDSDDDDDGDEEEDDDVEEPQQEEVKEQQLQTPRQTQQYPIPEPSWPSPDGRAPLRTRAVMELPATPQNQQGMPGSEEIPPPARPGQMLQIKQRPAIKTSPVGSLPSPPPDNKNNNNNPGETITTFAPAGASIGAPPPERRLKGWRQDREDSVQSASWVSGMVSGDGLTNDGDGAAGVGGGGGGGWSHASPGAGYHRPSMIEVTKSMGRVMSLNSTRSAGTLSTLGNGTVGAGGASAIGATSNATTTSTATTRPTVVGGGPGGEAAWEKWVMLQNGKVVTSNSTTTSREDELLKAYREEQDEPPPQPTYLAGQQQQQQQDDQPHPDLIVQYLMSMGITEEAAKQTAVQYHASNIGSGAARWTSSSSSSQMAPPPAVVGTVSATPTMRVLRQTSTPTTSPKVAGETMGGLTTTNDIGAADSAISAKHRELQRRAVPTADAAAASSTADDNNDDDDVSLGDYDEEQAAPPEVGSVATNLHDSMSSTLSESRRSGVPAPTTWPRAPSGDQGSNIRRSLNNPSAASLFVASTLSLDVPEAAEHDGELVEAKAIHPKEKKKPPSPVDDIVYAESTPLSIKHLWEERGVRRFVWLSLFVLFVVVAIVVIVVVTNGNRSSNGEEPVPLAPPTLAPSTVPTIIDSDIERAALAISNDTIFEEGSPQRRAIGWMSTFDNYDTDGYGDAWAQRYIIAVFYYATGGPKWNDQEQWLDPDVHECDWGVETILCSAVMVTGQRNVVGIYQTRNLLIGTIPNELSRLSLQLLRLSRNQLTGTIPQYGCDTWTKLYALDLSQNAFSGPIPENIGSCSGLLEIRLSSNALTGTLPTGLHSLSILQELDIENNQFSGPVTSDGIGGLASLKKINFRRNKFTGTLPRLELLPNLDVMWLDHNMFSGTLPVVPASLGERQELTISHNQLTGQIIFDLTTLDREIDYKISNIDFGFNDFTGAFPMFMAWIPSLRRLSLSGNKFTGSIPDIVFDAGPKDGWLYLEHLELAYNKLSGEIPISRTRPALNYLDLRGNMFEGGFTDKLQHMPRLEFLLLSDNPGLQDSLEATPLQNQTTLRALELRNTNLTGSSIPHAIGLLTKLNILDLGQSGLVGTIPTSFGQLTVMNTLRLDHNLLTGSIPIELANMTLLQQLDIQYNDLFGPFPEGLNDLPNLQMLNVSGNVLDGRITTDLCSRAMIDAVDVGCNLFCPCCSNLQGECGGDVFDP